MEVKTYLNLDGLLAEARVAIRTLERVCDALERGPDPRAPSGEGGERIEGVAFKDGDAFCTADDGVSPCQESWVFVPECKHESADEMAEGEVERRATLMLHDADPDPDDAA